MPVAIDYTPVILPKQDENHTEWLEEYRRQGGYEALKRALDMKPEELVCIVLDSGLRGR